MSKPKAPTLQIGDRVRERDSLKMFIAKPTSPGFAIARDIVKSERRGKIVEIETRKAANGSSYTYVSVLWDGDQRPRTHARQRIELVPVDPTPADTLL
jgi:hypothetical protein